MKKLFTIICLLLIAFNLFACKKYNNSSNISFDSKNKIKIVATIFPEYDWIKNILGEKVSDIELDLLLDNGVDLHNYQLTADDIMTISSSDIFVYVGGESDKWVEKVLHNIQNKNIISINLMELLKDSIKLEEAVEGMQLDNTEEEDHKENSNLDEEEYDEHVWLSLNNARIIVEELEKAIEKVDPENKNIYKTNANSYIQKIELLNNKYKESISNAKNNILLFADRFPFRYLVDDYNLKYYAAFLGCSSETEASFETINFLSNKIDELNLKYILTIEGNNKKIANTIIQNTKAKNQTILALNSMQATTAKDINNGVNYINIMENNLRVLEEALN